jgi:hypothetical protein
MKVARHEMPGMWNREARPGYGVIGRCGRGTVFEGEQSLAPWIIPFPSSVAILALADKTGRIVFARFPGISCLATFILSLRD